MGVWYPSALEKVLTAGFFYGTISAGIAVHLLDDTYTYDPTDTVLSDIPAGKRQGSPKYIIDLNTDDGVLSAPPIQVPNVLDGDLIAGFVVYILADTEAHSDLIIYENLNADGTLINLTVDGPPVGIVTIRWPGNVIGTI